MTDPESCLSNRSEYINGSTCVCMCVLTRMEDYLADMTARGRKPLTIAEMRRGILRCSEVLESRNPGIRPDEIGTPEICWIQTALRRRYKEKTVQSYVQQFGLYLDWLTGINPVRKARLMWNEMEPSRVWISREDYYRLMDAAGPRDKLILALGATMGLRRNEIMLMRVSDISDGEITIRGKGHGEDGKIVVKDMTDTVRKTLEAYLPIRQDLIRRYGHETDRLLLSKIGRPMDPTSICPILAVLRRKTGIEVTAHSLRRLYAMTMADAGVPLETLARMMRHECVQTTIRHYLKADPRRMADASGKVDAALGI